MRYRVTGQYFIDRQNDRNRGLSEGMLPVKIIDRTFPTINEAKKYVNATFPKPEKMREYSCIEEIV